MSDEKPPKRIAAIVLAVAAVLVGLVGVLVFAVGKSPTDFTKIVGTGFLIEAAAAMCGALLGFLFGIPRVATSSVDASAEALAAPGSDVRRYNVNTNLEQISDWLTKILVGVGLVQIGGIGSGLAQLVTFVSTDMGTTPAFAGGLIVYSVSAGLLGGYLLTRTILTQAFYRYDSLSDQIEKAEERAAAAEETSAQAEADVKSLTAVDAVLSGTSPADVDVLQNLFRSASPPVLSQVFRRARDARQRATNSSGPQVALTIPIFRALCEADSRKIYHRNYGELGFALKDQSQPEWMDAEKQLTEAIRIRDGNYVHGYRLYEFNRGICRIALGLVNGNEDEESVRADVIKDISEALKGSWTVKNKKLIETNSEITDWLARTGLDRSVFSVSD